MSRRFRNFLLIGAAVALLIVVGTIGLHLIEGWSWFDSFYMVVITLTTIGYSEVHPLSQRGREFNVALIVAGAVLMTLLLGNLTQFFLEVELLDFFGRRRMERQIGRMSGHYIICGAGRVGRSTARQLDAQGIPFVVIDQQEIRDDEFNREWPLLIGDATHEKMLRLAGIERAAGLVAATTSDAGNIFIVLNARSLNPKLKIIARASEDEAGKHLKKAGADVVVSPYLSAGQRIAQGLLRPNVLDFFDIAAGHDKKHGMVIEEIAIGSRSPLAGATVGESNIHRNFGIIVLAIKHPDGSSQFNPQANDRISAGDYLIVMGEPENMSTLQSKVVVSG